MYMLLRQTRRLTFFRPRNRRGLGECETEVPSEDSPPRGSSHSHDVEVDRTYPTNVLVVPTPSTVVMLGTERTPDPKEYTFYPQRNLVWEPDTNPFIPTFTPVPDFSTQATAATGRKNGPLTERVSPDGPPT